MKAKLPPVLEIKLVDFRRRVRVVKLAEGLFAAVFGIGLSYLLVFVLDRFLETPDWLRLGLVVAGMMTLGVGVPLKWHRWVWKQRGLDDAARLLRRTFPRLGDQLLGIVELARMDHGAAGRSERLVQAAMEQASDAVRDKDLSGAVPDARHHQWGWAAASVLVFFGLVFTMVNEAARNAFVRWITPWRKVERFTFAKTEALPDRLVVPYAEPFGLSVYLAANTLRSPDWAVARLGKQPERSASLESGSYRLVFPPQKQDERLAISLGDVRKAIAVQPRPRPELIELAVRVQLPAYLGYQSEQRIEVRGGSVSVVKDAKVGFEARANRTLASAQLDGVGQQIVSEKFLTELSPVSEDGERYFTWRDRDGLTPRDPLVLKVRAVEDEAPRIVARRDSLEQVVLDSEVVTFDVSAGDDFGLKSIGLEWVGALDQKSGMSQVQGEKIAAAGGCEKKHLDVRATFCATRDGVLPQTVEVRAWADDYLPGRKRSRSAAFVLHILDKTEHALWVTEQFGKWLAVAKESYEREQQLHVLNQELRALSEAELDRPENRRRVAEQAAAESANGAKLESLTQAGRSLVEQATRNEKFDAKRLESWATMLKSLKDIATARMPSVAGLLKQTANAAGAKSGAPSDSNVAPKPSAPVTADRESGFAKVEETKAGDLTAKQEPPGGGNSGLPGPTLGAISDPKKESNGEKSAAQQKIEAAIAEQKELLTEFAKVSDQLGEILSSLETSTFVKRLKAASKQQMSIATSIDQKTLHAFGIERAVLKEAEPIVWNTKEQSEVVRIIQSDLEAYFQRKSDNRLKRILEEMKKIDVVRALVRDGEMVAGNLSGQSFTASEFWADALDRWSEELVAASNGKPSSSSSGSGDSLPPEIVLKVMAALREEMKLRDETREVENAKGAVEEQKFVSDAQRLAGKQGGLGIQAQTAVTDILALSEGASKFEKELQLLSEVIRVMQEAEEILQTPETGGRALAAETEVIELLLQAKRNSSKGGKGGGSASGGGATAAVALSAALSDLGPGGDAESLVVTRPVGQATGRAGKEFPEEFKSGLDAYFNLLEGGRK